MATVQGSWIWYELMSPDPAGSKAFYEAVVGWSMTTGHGESADYGFITAPDGAMVGGLLGLTNDMTNGGARPCWLGYVGVDDVDASASAITAAGGSVMMPARDVEMAGRIAMGAVLYHGSHSAARWRQQHRLCRREQLRALRLERIDGR
jgi:uncharacterized protein